MTCSMTVRVTVLHRCALHMVRQMVNLDDNRLSSSFLNAYAPIIVFPTPTLVRVRLGNMWIFNKLRSQIPLPWGNLQPSLSPTPTHTTNYFLGTADAEYQSLPK